MQEDKTSKWFASQLRKQQEEKPLPYEPGAWEAFEKKRIGTSPSNKPYWIAGIAASLLLLLVAGGMWISTETQDKQAPLSGQIASEAQSDIALGEKPMAEDQGKLPEGTLAQAETGAVAEGKESTSTPNQVIPGSTGGLTPAGKAKGTQKKNQETAKSAASGEKAPLNALENPPNPVEKPLIAIQESQPAAASTQAKVAEEKALAGNELPKDPQLSQEEIAEILEEKSATQIALGLSPGFGASQNSGQSTTGTSLGLGVMVDREVGRKLKLGSGLAVNYLNQASESASLRALPNGAASGFSSVTDKQEIAQVQVDIPLYVRYAITRSESISVQAGFSNLITFNQNAEQQSSYDRQVSVLNSNTAGQSSYSTRTESLVQSSDLEVPQNQFYPFATANLGVNFRLFESKKTSYELMPFYNYPLQEFSGYGEKLGLFGASFRVNFGAIQKK